MWLEDRELRWYRVLVAVALPLFVLAHQPWLAGRRESRLTFVAFGVGFTAGLWIVGRMRHRGWAAFALFLTGVFGPWGHLFVAGLTYVGFAFVLLWRAARDLSQDREPPAPT